MGASTVLWGPPGTGKTTALVKTAPRPHLVIDVDNKIHRMKNLEEDLKDPNLIIHSLKKAMVEDPMGKRIKDIILKKPPKSEPLGYLEVIELINTLIDEPTHEGLELATVSCDSLTRLLEHLKRLILFHRKESQLTQPDWGTFLSNLEELFVGACSMRPNVIFTMHQKIVKDDITGRIQTLPSIEGAMANKVGSYFEEMYHMEVKVTGTKVTYNFLTVDEKLQVRTSHGLDVLAPADLSFLKEE